MRPRSNAAYQRSRDSSGSFSKTATHEETKGSDRARQGRCVNCCCKSVLPLIFLVIFILICFIFVVWTVWKPQQRCSGVDIPVSSLQACPAGWINYEGKCYFFSEEERTWTSSQDFCHSHGSTLSPIESEPEKPQAFISRYMGTTGHWIGLQKDSGQTWKWTAGTELKNMLEVRGENGDCAYLSTGFAMSSPCHVTRRWICSQPDTYTRNKGSTIRV